jgi:4-hydroxyphenylpyruvate dioxygenase
LREQDFLPLLGTDYVEFYVGNAKQSAHYYKTAFGYQSLAYAGLETGVKDRTSYVLGQDKVRIVLTTPLTQDSPIHEHLRKHGDGVKVAALWVEDATSAYQETMKRGARSFMDQQLKKMNLAKWFVQGFILTEKPFMFLLSVKNKGCFLQVIRNGNQITIQSQQG